MTNEEAIVVLQKIKPIPHRGDGKSITHTLEIIAIDMAIRALEQEDVLDKIRAEIEQLTSRYSISKERGGMGIVEWSDRLIEESDVLQVIDKYKADKEDKE